MVVAIGLDAQLERLGQTVAQEGGDGEDLLPRLVVALAPDLDLEPAASERPAAVGDSGAVGIDQVVVGLPEAGDGSEQEQEREKRLCHPPRIPRFVATGTVSPASRWRTISPPIPYGSNNDPYLT